MKISKVLLVLSVIIVAASGCFTERISNQNLSYLYDRDASFMHPEFNVLHKNDSVTELHFRLNSNELLYLHNPESNFYSAFFRIRYEVYTQLESKLLIDSSVVVFADSSLLMQGKTISGILELKPSKVKQSLLKIDLVDLRRNSRIKRYFEIDRRNPNCRQFFTLQLANSNQALSRNYIKADEQFTLDHVSGKDRAIVRYYNREFPLPKPPFSVETPKVFDYQADSIFELPLGQPLTLPKEGFYHFQVSDSTKDGFTLYRFDETFPAVKDVNDLIEPLRFINSNTEYKTIKEADFPKAEVDRFWLKLAGNQDRARVLIQKYYSRVENSNEFFTSYTEGWKSDRGLIYLIFGQPNIIYKNSNSEHWIYGEEENPASLGMTFYKVENPFSDNDFRLDRSPIYKSSWYSAVDMWRQGRVYTDN
jgi:GWxTD domain-containing protein